VIGKTYARELYLAMDPEFPIGGESCMRLDIVGKGTVIVSHLIGRVADRIKKLSGSSEEIDEVRVTLLQHNDQYEARVRLLFADQTLCARQHGLSPDAAIGAALQGVEESLAQYRSR
jgi:ribosome-associated translation inhibitor RaiA